MYYSKHPQKTPIQEFHKTTFPTFGPSVWDINDSAPSHRNYQNELFKTSPKTIHPRIRKNSLTRFRTIFCIFLLIYKSAA